MRICSAMEPRLDLVVLKSYERDVIANRNILAHAREVEVDGTPALESRRDGELIVRHDQSMLELRHTLRQQRTALEMVCDSVKSYFSKAMHKDS